jgi:hypothetical protein
LPTILDDGVVGAVLNWHYFVSVAFVCKLVCHNHLRFKKGGIEATPPKQLITNSSPISPLPFQGDLKNLLVAKPH